MASSCSGAVIVLGMHRSGTSCLAGSLEEAGLYLGEVNRVAPHNRKGNNENLRIMELHDSILTTSGGSWREPPEVVSWQPEHRSIRDELIGAYQAHGLWGFKDPRSLLLLEGWLDVLPAARFVGTFRHPAAVARSLQKRDGTFDFAGGVALWALYNARLLRYQRQLGFELVCFDSHPEQYHSKLTDICESLGLNPPACGFSFFESELRHHDRAGDVELPETIDELYRELKVKAS